MTEEQTTKPASSENTNTPITKVFVGNLSFRTRGPGLREAFEAAGKVEGVRVVTQGRRSMGYGFVQFALLDEAKKAVELLHKSTLDSREINVEISTSSNTGINPTKRRRPRTRKPKKASETATNETAAADATPAGDAAPKKKNRRTRKAPKKKRSATEATTDGSPAPADGTAPATKAKAPRKPRAPREPREPREHREPREPKEPREPREFSTTVLYVSNIPFSLENEGLLEAFKEFEPTSANIIRRNRTNLSKGFGFVEFADADKQQAALDAKHKSKLGEREITVRKAHIRPPTDESATTANATTEGVEPKTE